ncbi:cold-shock protein [Mucilaginibacter ximonensis]|uniref:Cold-shock protein n=1 Tax=Mucilaginibacter ximonensis TaxID=538021 RepID=A0ABW5YF66_9SPHI
MAEDHYNTLRYRIGTVKNLVEDKGFGFISAMRQDGGGDIFFHYKQMRSAAVAVKDLVVYLVKPSRKHEGKEEAAGVALLRDVIDYKKLLQLYLVYGLQQICTQLVNFTVEERAQADPAYTLRQVWAHELCAPFQPRDSIRYQRFIRFMAEDAALPLVTFADMLHVLLEKDTGLPAAVLFLIFRHLKQEPTLTASYDLRALYEQLDAGERETYFADLPLPDRLELSALKEISTDEQFQSLLRLLGPEADAALNFATIRDQLQIADHFQPLLWLRDMRSEFPAAELCAAIASGYTVTERDALLDKMSIDQQVSIFPFEAVTEPAAWSLFVVFLNRNENRKLALQAFLASGLRLSPYYYLRCVTAGFLPIADADEALLKAGLPGSVADDQQQLIAKVGADYALRLFSDQLAANAYETLKLILSSLAGGNRISRIRGITDELAIRLWQEGFLDRPAVPVLAAHLLLLTDAKTALAFLEKTGPDREDILQQAGQLLLGASGSDHVPVLHLLGVAKQCGSPRYDHLRFILYEGMGDWIRLYLWLYDHSETIAFGQFSPYFVTLTAAEQKRFLKKTFWELSRNPAAANLRQVLALRDSAVDPALSRQAGSQPMDFTVYVVLQAMEDLAAGSVTRPDVIYKIISQQIRSPEELLVLHGFFDKCQGRLGQDRSVTPAKDQLIPLKSERGPVPEGIIYCEGRKALIKGTSQAARCEQTGLEFWWCHNQKCYGSCISSHEDWEHYTLLDLLRIAGIPFAQADYELLLGYINKVNKFLSHMKCAHCKHILRPITDGATRNYGFYRVSHFACDNPECGHRGEQVYLSHCTNGACSGVIDSRGSVKCKTKGAAHPDKGWYICKDCLACCNTEGIGKRAYILDLTGQHYGGPIEGHRDRGIICCPKCGTEMDPQTGNAGDYQRILNWYITNRYTARSILSSGQRKDGKYWFLLQAPHWDADKLREFKQKLYRYIAAGFNVPDIRLDKESYLLAEGYGDRPAGEIRLLECPACHYQLDLVSDMERFVAMRHYHTNIHMSGFRNPE